MTARSGRLRIALIGSSRYPIAEPFAGGLEAHIWHLARDLDRRGHEVTLFAAPGSDPQLPVETIAVESIEFSPAARADVSMPAEWAMAEHHAYLSLMIELAGARADDFDVVHNHSLHYLPPAMAPSVRAPLLTTLHTPPTPWLESALRTAGGRRAPHLAAVSAYTARAWAHVAADIDVVRNGVDLSGWPVGDGGSGAIWFGRLVPEKGADLALAAARIAGIPLTLAGPVVDQPWFDRAVAPHLGDGVDYIGHVDQDELAKRVGAASVALLTPTWDEPYGLVVAEALACGTPVAAFARGGIPEIVSPECAELVAPGDVEALARAVRRAARLSRPACRARAEHACSLDRMVGEYEAIYRRLIAT